jgi:hypothetical protein
MLTDGIGETPSDIAPNVTEIQDHETETTRRPQASGTIDPIAQETGGHVSSISNSSVVKTDINLQDNDSVVPNASREFGEMASNTPTTATNVSPT